MNEICEDCGNVLVFRSTEGACAIPTLLCPACTTVTVKLPHNSLKAKRTAAVLEHYREMPFQGKNDGDTYYITTMDAICRWDAKENDYEILQLNAFKWPNPEDKFNNRRGAILSQRARKGRPHGECPDY